MNYLALLPIKERLHCRRVAAVSKMLADAAGLSAVEADSVERAAILHDVGKAALPQELLCQDRPLSARQQTVFRSHAELGMRLLRETEGVLSTASIVALQHHERLDGSGYYGLTEQAIHPHAKLVAAADVFDTAVFCGTAEVEQGLVRACLILVKEGGQTLSQEHTHFLLSHLDEVMVACEAINAHNPSSVH